MGLSTRVITLCLAVLFGISVVSGDSPSVQDPAATSPISRVAQGLNPANWKMPQFNVPDFRSLLPGQQDKDRIIKKKDNLIDDVSKTASNSWQKTKTALNPMKLAPSNLFSGSPAEPQQADPQRIRTATPSSRSVLHRDEADQRVAVPAPSCSAPPAPR